MSIAIMTMVWARSFEKTGAKMILLKLADYADDSGENIFPSIDTVASYCGVNRSTVQRNIAWAVEQGILILVAEATRYDPKRYKICLETLRDYPLVDAELERMDRAEKRRNSANAGRDGKLPPLENESETDGGVRGGIDDSQGWQNAPPGVANCTSRGGIMPPEPPVEPSENHHVSETRAREASFEGEVDWFARFKDAYPPGLPDEDWLSTPAIFAMAAAKAAGGGEELALAAEGYAIQVRDDPPSSTRYIIRPGNFLSSKDHQAKWPGLAQKARDHLTRYASKAAELKDLITTKVDGESDLRWRRHAAAIDELIYRRWLHGLVYRGISDGIARFEAPSPVVRDRVATNHAQLLGQALRRATIVAQEVNIGLRARTSAGKGKAA